MGWSSGGYIFDAVADETIVQVETAACSEEAATAILASLAKELLDGDWDTEYESYGIYRDKPYIVAALKKHVPDIDKYADEDWEDDEPDE